MTLAAMIEKRSVRRHTIWNVQSAPGRAPRSERILGTRHGQRVDAYLHTARTQTGTSQRSKKMKRLKGNCISYTHQRDVPTLGI